MCIYLGLSIIANTEDSFPRTAHIMCVGGTNGEIIWKLVHREENEGFS